MKPYAARWCHACLRPLADDDRDVVYLFMRIDDVYRDIVVHGHCYEPDRIAAPSPLVGDSLSG